MSAARYAPVVAALPEQLPAVDRHQAAVVYAALVRRFWPGSGRRYTSDRAPVRRCWLSRKPTVSSNSDKGLGRLVHDFSHDVFSAVYPRRKPHDPLHAKYEADVAAWVAERVLRWFPPPVIGKGPPCTKCQRVREYSGDYAPDGVLSCIGCGQPWPKKPTTQERRARELIRTEDAIVRWESKAKRAATRLKKLRTKQRRLIKLTGALN